MDDSFFINKMFYRMLIPSFIAGLGMAFSNIADSLMIGTRIGEAGLAAIGFASPLFMLFNFMDIGLAVGGSVHYTRLLSQGKAREAVSLFNSVLLAAIVISTAIVVVGNQFIDVITTILGASTDSPTVYHMTKSYVRVLLTFVPVLFINFTMYYFIRCDDNAKLASVGFTIGNILDVVLSYVLIITLDMGVKGSAYATIIGTAVSIVICAPHLFYKHSILSIDFSQIHFKPVWRAYQTGLASSAHYVYVFAVLVVFNHIISTIGGETGVAVFNIVTNLSYFVMYVFDSLCSTLQPLAGTFHGEKNRNSANIVVRASIKTGMLIAGVLTAAAFLPAEQLCGVFGLKATESLTIGTDAIRIYCISILFAGANIVAGSFYQSIEMERRAYSIHFLRSLLLPVIFGFLLSTQGLQPFWFVYAATEIATFIFWCAYAARKRGSADNDEHKDVYSTVIRNKNDDVSAVLSDIEAFCERWEAAPDQSCYVMMTVEEICSVIMLNAFGSKGHEYIQITLIAENGNDFVLHMRDSFSTFNPFQLATQKIKNDRDVDGAMDSIGMLLVKSKAKEFFYRRYQGFNTLTIRV